MIQVDMMTPCSRMPSRFRQGVFIVLCRTMCLELLEAVAMAVTGGHTRARTVGLSVPFVAR